MLALLLAVENPLAAAIEGYWSGESVTEQLTALHEARPDDPERRYWLARTHLDNGRCREAADLLQNRVSEGPDWRLRVVEGLAAVCLDELDRGWALLSVAAPEMTPDPLREQVWAATGVLAVRRGEPAAAWLHLAGGDPQRVLSPSLARVLPDAVLGAECADNEGRLRFDYSGRRWEMDLASCVAAPVVEAESDLPSLVDVAVCEGELVWATPNGIERGAPGDGRLVSPSKAGFSLEAPQCYDGALWTLRRGPDGDLVQRDDEPVVEGVALAGFEISEAGLLLSVVADGPEIWWVVDGAPEALVRSPLPLARPARVR
jgi:hypothetical protein